MALDGTFAGMVTSVGDFLNRTDLTASIPDFIIAAESELNRVLRIADMISSTTLVVSTASTALPSDFNGIVSFELPAGTGAPLRYMRPEELRALKQQLYTSTGTPFGYSVIGTNLETVPAPSGSLTCTLVYYKRLAALTASNTTNWLSLKHPDIYLFGSLLVAAPYLKDDNRLPVWQGMYGKAVADLLESDKRTAYGHNMVSPVRGSSAPMGTTP